MLILWIILGVGYLYGSFKICIYFHGNPFVRRLENDTKNSG